MLRRLNVIGREAPILKEIENLPKSTNEVYRLLLDDCQRPRTENDRQVLRKFFSWLAYVKAPLNMGSATKLLTYIDKDNSLSVDDEVEHRSAALVIQRRRYLISRPP